MVSYTINLLDKMKKWFYTETEVDTKLSGKADKNHASTSSEYGVGSTSNYGHVKVDSSLSGSSTNPVQNKVVNSALSGKSDTSHTHDDRYYTESEVDTKLGGYATNEALSSGLGGKADNNHRHYVSPYNTGTIFYEKGAAESESTVLDNLVTTRTPTSRGDLYNLWGNSSNYDGLINLGFIVDNLNYLIGDLYDKFEDASFDIQIVNSLPSTGVSGTLYFVSDSSGSGDNNYVEYVYTNDKWEELGRKQVNVDISNKLESSDFSFSFNDSTGELTLTINR